MSRLAPFSGGLLRLAGTTTAALALVVTGLVVADTLRRSAPTRASTLSYDATEPASESTLGRADQRFVAVAATRNAEAREIAELAAARAANDLLRKYAQRLAGEHRQIGDELRAIAARRNFAVTVDPVRERVRHRLTAGAPVASDQAYLRELANAQDDAVALFENAARDSEDVDLRDLARRARETLQREAATAARLRKQRLD